MSNIQDELEHRISEKLHNLIFHTKSIEEGLKILNDVKTILIWDWNKTRCDRNRNIVKLEKIFLQIELIQKELLYLAVLYLDY